MRFTIIDTVGAVSFVAECNLLTAIVAACARGPQTLEELLEAVDQLDRRLRDYVGAGLAVFDEHNSPENLAAIHGALEFHNAHDLPVFRVLDDRTRQASLQPVKAGVIIFNLSKRRIVQVMNTYTEITRRGQARVHDGDRFTAEVYRYELPGEWRLVPG